MNTLARMTSLALLALALLAGAACMAGETSPEDGPAQSASGLLMAKGVEINERALAAMEADGIDAELAETDQAAPYLEQAAREVLAEAGIELLEGVDIAGLSWSEILELLMLYKGGELTLRGILSRRGRDNLAGLLGALNPDRGEGIAWGDVSRRLLALDGWQHSERGTTPPPTGA